MASENPYDKVFEEAAEIEHKIAAIEERHHVERTKLLAKYELEKAPLYKERSDVLSKIEGFWSIVLGSIGEIESLMVPSDEEALSNLSDILVERDASNPTDFTISLLFAQNEFFKNETITKSFKFNDGVYTTSKADIDWHAGKDLVLKDDGEEEEEEDSEIPIIIPGFFTWLATDTDKLGLGEQIANEIYPNAMSFFQSATTAEDDLDDSDLEAEEDIEHSEDEEDVPATKKHKK